MTVAADALPTVQINGVVWNQLVIGSTVYAAGSFTRARPAGAAAGTSETVRENLLAYDLTTGVLKTGFVANLNAEARYLAKSPDGSRLYVGGAFTSVNGVTRTRIAALDPATGTPLAGFAPVVNANVKAIAATATTVYLGGEFSTINGNARSRLGAVTATTGGTVANFAPKVGDNSVQAMVLSPDQSKLVVGGSFTTLNGSSDPGYGLGALDAATGASLPFGANRTIRNGGLNAAILNLSSDGTRLYGSGFVFGAGGNLEGAFSASWSDPALNLGWVEDCHGDTYGVYGSGSAVYVAGHPHFCGNVGGFPETTPRTHHRALAFSKAATGTVAANSTGSYFNFAGAPAPTLQNWFPDFNAGTYTGATQGPWAVTGSGPYVLYGGEFTRVNGTAQQGLARLATKETDPGINNKQGPKATGADFQPTLSSTAPDSVTVSWPSNWDPDNANLTYTLYQDDVAVLTRTAASTFWNRPRLTYTVTGVTGPRSYKVTVRDPFGNSVTSPSVRPAAPTVTSRTPTAGATGVAVGTTTTRTPVRATFSDPVSGVSSSTYTLRRGTTTVSSAVRYDAATRTATLTPAAPLAADTTYTVAITAGVRGVGGEVAPQSWTFVTGPAPKVSSTTPAGAATGVSRTADVRATFSEAVTGLPTTAAASASYTVKATTGGAVFPATARYDATNRVGVLNPTGTLAANTQYTVTLTNAVKDRAGNPLAVKSWTFKTGTR